MDPQDTVIRQAYEGNTADTAFLRRECIRGFGSVTNGYRADVYSRILNAHPLDIPLGKSQHHNQLVLDVRRTYGQLLTLDEAAVQQERLLRVLDGLFVMHVDLKYYQGFHDVVSILLLIIDDDRVVMGITERLAMTRFKASLFDFSEAMEGGRHALEKVKDIDSELSDALEEGGCDGMFTFPWFITWFLHSISSLGVAVRLIDFFVCTEDKDLENFIAATVISNRGAIFELPEIEYSLIHIYFTNTPSHFTIRDIQKLINMTVTMRDPSATLKQLLAVTPSPYDIHTESRLFYYVLLLSVYVLVSSILVYFNK